MRADHHLGEQIDVIKKINESGMLLFTYGADKYYFFFIRQRLMRERRN